MNQRFKCCTNESIQDRFTIIVENHENDRDYIEVTLNEKIFDVKKRIFNQQINPAKSQLYFKRTKLQNDQTIKDCQLKQDSMVYIIYGDNISE
ncbi:unnamed protein product [Paramecium octaurelia]|uniref:Ubiquitin-like domain-containing protein n=1 Tax=Paramecium octaurelia TaxID=43137 RepID=A0A8S1T303_PAROT|nr:unnamed protein product [Paramecium octaurelia]